MERNIIIKNMPQADELWAGIGGHFDSLGQIINEFIDNSVSNFIANNTEMKNINISLYEISRKEDIKVIIEDSGTGIKKLDESFTLGSCKAAETPLNEHGFGMKHALASANPKNDAWKIYTRTQDDLNQGIFKLIQAPYQIKNYTVKICNDNWPGQMNSTGTIIEFDCKYEMYKTITRGVKGGMSNFTSIADVLCEELGVTYANVISEKGISIAIHIFAYNSKEQHYHVGAVTPNWEEYIKPGSGSEEVDLGNGKILIDYKFGKINEKPERKAFDNTTTRKYYKKNMYSSGVEIRINGRVLCHSIFKEIWNKEKHNSYNNLLIIVNLISNDLKKLPKTRTSKNGLREGDRLLDKLYEWIRSNMKDPVKDSSCAKQEIELFEIFSDNYQRYNEDKNLVISLEQYVFTHTENPKDRVRLDCYCKTSDGVTIYEGKKDTTTSKDVYQLRMYWDGLVFDGVNPKKAVLIASEHTESVKTLISVVNTMKDANGNNYNLNLETWFERGINVK